MSFDTAMFIVCILVINAFIFAAMRSPRICAIIFGTILAVPYFILGGIYDSLPQYPEPHKITGFCNMNSTDLCPNGLHPDGSYVIYQLLLVINPQISLFLVIVEWLLPLIAVTLAYYIWSLRPRSELKISR
jgi:hypothetical protein